MDEEFRGDDSLPLPNAFVDFLTQNGVSPTVYAASRSIPRYVRLKPGCETQIDEIEAEIKADLKEVNWLPNFYEIPPDTRISSTKPYKEGKIYGIDAASGAAVLALNISPGDDVLDLCAAPGAKLCMIADLLGCSGSVTGVDVARHRLAATKTMIQKYALGHRCRLFVADGTKFSIIPSTCSTEANGNLEVYKEWTPQKTWKERKRLAKMWEKKIFKVVTGIEDPELIFYGCNSGIVGASKNDVHREANDLEILQLGYDKVLVDAECTHDGSIKHIQKFEQWGWTTLPHRVLDAQRTDELFTLQLNLLTNGFRLLKSGGSLVYSTCSLTVAQNEVVVERFLSQHHTAKLVEIEESVKWPCREGKVAKTIRFDPASSRTSGLFLAKFTKLTTAAEP